MTNKIELKSIRELLGMNFFIPSYQRGYRWTKQQVKDLLEDIQEFISRKQEGFYCIQPLVVKKSIPDETEFRKRLIEIEGKEDLLQETERIISDFTRWEVIDGQQRLTTIYILLSCLDTNSQYQIEYETRTDSKNFLEKINISKENLNIDYFHMVEAKKQIDEWIGGNDKDEFEKTLLDNVKFIWYESKDEDPIKVFTRLNIGKISLTNAELIKALFLNKSNFQGNEYERIKLQQQEIASEWDMIEYTLQNDEFWLFLNSAGYDKPTRIDFIFDLMCEENILALSDDEIKETGNDTNKTFRYFYAWFKRGREKREKIDIVKCWQKVKEIFQIFQEWFNDLELYHYVGYLLSEVNKQSISKLKTVNLVNEWKKETLTKQDFVDYLILEIKKTLYSCLDLNKQYEASGNPKTQCRPILLLHNIQTIINQNKDLKESEKYELPVFYKFPFHLFKKEGWDVEHIDSNTENQLEGEKEQKEWLKYSLLAVQDDTLRKEISNFICKKIDYEESSFSDLYKKVTDSYCLSQEENRLSDDEKNRLWNFCLLDSSTNRSYGNAIFPAKRRILIGKDQGKEYEFEDNLEIILKDGTISFIPTCTKNVFLKYFNHSANSLREWDKQDAKAYLENINSVLKDFLSLQKKGEQNNEQ